ncbi:MAG TPA: hypothetical protein VMT03_13090 [Polyangia bacterium]|nr:hypothetical protein [Polyangia bacterium]
MRPQDTTPDSHARQLEVYRRLGPTRRVGIAARLSADIRRLARDGIRSRHPEYSELQLDGALRRLLYGNELCQRAWPGSPLPAP